MGARVRHVGIRDRIGDESEEKVIEKESILVTFIESILEF